MPEDAFERFRRLRGIADLVGVHEQSEKEVPLDVFEERAAIMEYDGGLDRQVAEAMARQCVLRGL